jgi:hypothetical protein
MSESKKLCVDCKYFSNRNPWSYEINCWHPKNLEESLVTGRVSPNYPPISLRLDKFLCGEVGEWYENKPVIEMVLEPIPEPSRYERFTNWVRGKA